MSKHHLRHLTPPQIPALSSYYVPAFMFKDDQAAADPTKRDAIANFMMV